MSCSGLVAYLHYTCATLTSQNLKIVKQVFDTSQERNAFFIKHTGISSQLISRNLLMSLQLLCNSYISYLKVYLKYSVLQIMAKLSVSITACQLDVSAPDKKGTNG